MYDTILVPLDGSELAENALVYARSIAEVDNSQLVLVRATKSAESLMDVLGQMSYSVITAEQALGSAEQYLDATRQAHAMPDATIRTHSGLPASIILDSEQNERANLIVMSTQGRSGVGRWVMGSVASKVLQQAQVPVLIVRDRRPIKRILVPLDGSTLSEIILSHAIHLAKIFEAEVTLLRVTKAEIAPTSPRRVTEVVTTAISNIPPAIIEPEYNEHYLEVTANRLSSSGIPIHIVERTGDAVEVILQVGKEHDLIAMSTHGYGGLERFVFGSVMEKILRGTDQPMLIVRPWL